jgi:hypothetical protein
LPPVPDKREGMAAGPHQITVLPLRGVKFFKDVIFCAKF